MLLALSLLLLAVFTVHASGQTIPRVLHQVWRDESVPVRVDPYIRSWARTNPSWQYKLWTHAAARELVASRFSHLLAAYDALPSDAARSEYARYCIMSEHGGVYADLDVEILKPLDDLLDQHTLIVGYEPLEHSVVLHDADLVISSAVIASIPSHPFWLSVLTSSFTGSDVLYLTKTLDTYNMMLATGGTGLPVHVAQSSLFYPTFSVNDKLREKCNDHVNKLSARQVPVCGVLKATDFHNHGASQDSYCVKHWTDLHISKQSNNLSFEYSSKGIPKLIHFIWTDDNIPVNLRGYVQTWITKHPTWKVTLWSDADILVLIKTKFVDVCASIFHTYCFVIRYPQYLAVYNGYEKNIFRADFARYAVLDSFGGLYIGCILIANALLGVRRVCGLGHGVLAANGRYDREALLYHRLRGGSLYVWGHIIYSHFSLTSTHMPYTTRMRLSLTH